MSQRNEYKVSHIKKESLDTVTLCLTGPEFTFKAGQYVAIYLDLDRSSHGKFYTISSSPVEKLAITVKKVGKFSSILHDLHVGNTLYLSGPYGWFYPKEEMDNLVFLAAGVGITPFVSILKDYIEKGVRKKITLFYTNRHKEEACFCEVLDKMVLEKTLSLYYHFTSNESRLNAELISGKIKKLDGKNFYVCGPVSFVIDMRRQLLAKGVEEERIFTESFF